LSRSASVQILREPIAGTLSPERKPSLLVELALEDSEPISRVYLVKSNSEPLTFRVRNIPSLIPSLYSLWDGILTLPYVTVNSHVSAFLLGGAHVMLPGIIRGPKYPIPNFREGDILSVCVYGSSTPFAIGVAEMSSSSILSAADDGKGKAVSIIHFFGDHLWQLGSKRVPEGFGFDRIVAVRPSVAEVMIPASESIDSAPPKSIDLTTEECDLLFQVSFLEVACSLDSARDLPMESSSLYSRIQLVAKRIIGESSNAFLTSHGLGRLKSIDRVDVPFKLDIKQSSYKQLKQFVVYLEKESLVKSKNSQILSVNFQMARLRDYSPMVVKEEVSVSEKLVELFFGLTNPWAELIGIPDNKTVFPMSALTGKFSEWTKNGLKPGPMVEPVDPSKMALIRRVSGNTDPISKKNFNSQFHSDLIIHHQIRTEVPPRLRRGSPPKINLKVKKIQGKKFTTEISGLDKYFIPEDEIAKLLAKFLALSCSNTEPGIVLCQGNKSEAVKNFLIQEVGIPEDCINVTGRV
jgi:translation initiation factor 2D